MPTICVESSYYDGKSSDPCNYPEARLPSQCVGKSLAKLSENRVLVNSVDRVLREGRKCDPNRLVHS